jgi:hypothetical protein
VVSGDTEIYYYCNGTPTSAGATINFCAAPYSSTYNQCGPGSGSCQQNCACTPQCSGKACGAADGCGGQCSSGSCGSPYTCGGSGVANECGCSDVLGAGSPVIDGDTNIYYYCNGTPTSAGATFNWCPGGYTSVFNQCGPGNGSCQQNCMN